MSDSSFPNGNSGNSDWGSSNNPDWNNTNSSGTASDSWNVNASGNTSSSWGESSWNVANNSGVGDNSSWNVSNSEQSGNDWGSSGTWQDSGKDWDNSEVNEDWGNTDNFYNGENQTQENISPVQEKPIKTFNLSHKQIGIVIAVVLVVASLVLLIIDNTKVQSKQPKQQKVSTQQTTGNSQPDRKSTTGGSSNTSGISMVEIPENTDLDYESVLLEGTGTVTKKVKYLNNHQVVYCLVINIAVGSAQEVVTHFCSYDIYSSVNIGDLIKVTYQQVQSGYISVNKVTKD